MSRKLPAPYLLKIKFFWKIAMRSQFLSMTSKQNYIAWLKLHCWCDSMGQGIQEWTKQNLWKTAFKKFEGISSDHINSNFLKAIFRKFYFFQSWILCSIWPKFLENLAKFTGKHLCREALARAFPCEFFKPFKTPFSENNFGLLILWFIKINLFKTNVPLLQKPFNRPALQFNWLISIFVKNLS